MPILDISINGRIHQIACGDGEEGHLHSLGRDMDERVRSLASAMGGSVPDNILLLLSSLTLLDELHEMKELNRHLKIQIENHSQAFESAKQFDIDASAASAYDEMAQRVFELVEASNKASGAA